MEGKIVSTVGGVYTIYVNGITYNVFPKGIFKFKKQHLCVGDNVEFNENELVIEKILDRKNELIRPRSANVDLLLITMSVVEPELSAELLYKFLTYANMHAIEAKVLFTKLDLLKDRTYLDSLIADLKKLGFEVFTLAKNDKNELSDVIDAIKGKTTIVMGQTGVGKSSFINLLDENFDRKIGSFSEALGRGKHQTKEVILLPFNGGYIGDTPGFSSLDLELFKEDLAQFFPGYNSYYTECYFSNCLHQNEKECKIKEEISNGNLSKEGYEIYLKLLASLKYRSERYSK